MSTKSVDKNDDKAVKTQEKAPAPEGRSYKKDVKGVSECCKDDKDVLKVLSVKESKKEVKKPKLDPNKLGPEAVK
jgi:hypothetical protein